MNTKYIIFDGNNLAHIAFHRAKSIILKNKQKEYIEHHSNSKTLRSKIEKQAKEKVLLVEEDFKKISGMMFLVFFRKLHKHYKMFDGQFIMTWDNPNSHEWRKQIYPDYKCRRDYDHDPIWKVLFNNMEEIKKVLAHYPISQIGIEGLEADDIMYVYSKLLSECNTVIIISSDSDLIQIAQEFKNIKIYHPIRDIYVAIPKDYSIVDYKAFKGDKSDDIGGVPGFGEKKALKAAREIANGQTLVEILKNAVSKKKVKETDSIVAENKKIVERNIMIIKISNNPTLKDLSIDKSLHKDTSTINLKAIQAFYFKHKLFSLLEEFSRITAIFTK